MTPHDSAGWMLIFICFGGICSHWIRGKPSVFCAKCGNPSMMHKSTCPEK